MTSSGTLLIVSTPIGNADDITLRAIKALGAVDLIVCEEETEGIVLLQSIDIDKPLLELNNETMSEDLDVVLGILQNDQQVAYVHGSGTPLPTGAGLALVQRCLDAGIGIEVIPGASSMLTAVVRSGFDGAAFLFAGSLPAENADERQAILEQLSLEPRTIVLLETEERLRQTLEDLAQIIPERQAYVGCNLTRPSETHHYAHIAELTQKFTEKQFTGDAVICLEGSMAASRSSLEEDMAYNNSNNNRRGAPRKRRDEDSDGERSTQPMSNESRLGGYGGVPGSNSGNARPAGQQRNDRGRSGAGQGRRQEGGGGRPYQGGGSGRPQGGGRAQGGSGRPYQGGGGRPQGPRQGGPGQGQGRPYGEGRPQHGEGRPQHGEGRPQHGEGRPQRSERPYNEGRPQGQGGSRPPYRSEGRPQHGEGRPQHGEGRPQHGEGRPPRSGQGRPQGGGGRPYQGGGQGRPQGGGQGRPQRGGQGRPQQGGGRPYNAEQRGNRPSRPTAPQRPPADDESWQPMTNESAFLKQVSSTRGGSNRYGGGAGGQQRRRNSAPRPGGAQRPGFKRNAPQPFNTGGPRPKRASDDAKRGKVFTRDGYISNDFTEEKKPTEMKMRSRRKKNTDSPED